MPGSRREDDHRAAVERSRRRWNFWSSRWGLVERDSADIRRRAVEAAALEPGDVVLDVGCGPGVNFELLRERVGSRGRVVGIDLSDGMVRRARARVREHGWANVEVLQGDATCQHFSPGVFDGAVATTALVAMPDVTAAVRNVYEALRPGSRLGLYELRLVPTGPARVLNPLLDLFYRLFGNWNPDEAVLDALATTFDDVTVLDTMALRTNYVALATKAADPETRTIR